MGQNEFYCYLDMGLGRRDYPGTLFHRCIQDHRAGVRAGLLFYPLLRMSGMFKRHRHGLDFGLLLLLMVMHAFFKAYFNNQVKALCLGSWLNTHYAEAYS